MAPAGTLLLFICTASALLRPALLSSGTDISYLDRSLLEKDIAAVFNKVAYGGVTTTKRSISSKYFPSPGSPTTVAPFSSISVPTPPSKSITPPYTTTMPNASVVPFTPPKTLFPPSFTTPTPREVPSYIPPIRSFFTPPLPPEYANPFADKPTLRGSNSDTSSSHAGRRPIPPPPRPPSGRDRIPLRPPDLVPSLERDNSGSLGSTSDRKKPLNTPSFNRPPEAPYSELEKSPGGSSNQRPLSANESDFDFVPIHYSSVSRILSGSNGRKPEAQPPPEIFQRPETKLPRMPEMFPKLAAAAAEVPKAAKTDIPIPPPPPQQPMLRPDLEAAKAEGESGPSVGRPQTPNIPSNTDSIVDHKQGEDSPDVQLQPPKENERDKTVLQNGDIANPSRSSVRSRWRLAWDVHVYLIASLFTVLALYSVYNIFRINICKRLLSRGYYITLHCVLLTIGVVRSVYLFYDAYNLNNSFPEPVSHLLLNIVSPLLTSAFIVLFIFLLYASKVHMFSLGLQRPFLTGIFITLHILLCITLDLSTGIDPTMTYLPLICQSIFIILCICLGLAYLYAFKHLSRSAGVRKQDNIFGSGFTNIARPTLALAVRATLATALLALMMAAVQLYGILGAYNVTKMDSDKTQAWLWWGYQFSVRVIEVSMCFLLSWAGVQPLRLGGGGLEDEKESQNSGFALFRCGQCNNTPQSSEATDDIYPAVCVTNQAIHEYTVRTGKKVYDDSFPLNNLHSGFPLPESALSISTSERRSLRKAGYATHDAPYPINGTGTLERRSAVKKSGTFDMERPDLELPFGSSNEVRRSLKNSSVSGSGSAGGGTLISLTGDREQSVSESAASSTLERRSMKKSGTVEPVVGFPGSSDTARRSLKKSGTLASLSADSRRTATPVLNQHRSGMQTLSSSRERGASPSMLVAENGFVRFRALADPDEQDPEDTMAR